MNVRTLIPLVLFGAAISGCGNPIGSSSPSTPAATPGAAASGQVTVVMKEWSIDVSPASVPAGTTTLNVRDEGKEPHGLYIEGPGIDRKASRTEPGQTGTLTLTCSPGEFNISDFVKDNETAHNMKAKLTVK